MARFIGLAQASDNTSSDPPNNNGNHAKSDLLSNSSGRRRDVNEVLQLDTVENGMAHADVREVHAEKLAVDTLALSALALFRAQLLNGSPHSAPT
jgi:hypothetical protein